MASVQENKPPVAPTMQTNRSPKDADKKAILENIQAIVPDHEARVQSMQAADALREKKKKITSSQDAMKFEKSLEMASKNLKEGGDKKEERKLSDAKKEKDMAKLKDGKAGKDQKCAKEVKKMTEKEMKKAEKEMKKAEKEKMKMLEKEKKKAEKESSKNKDKNKGDKKVSPKEEKGRKGSDHKVKEQDEEHLGVDGGSLDRSPGSPIVPGASEQSPNLKELEDNVANVHAPPSVERIRVPSGPVATAAPAPKLSSFSPSPASNYESFCTNYSRLLAANPRSYLMSTEPVYSRPRTMIETNLKNLNDSFGNGQSGSPMTSRSDSPKSNTQLENPYAIGRPRPASISGPIPELELLCHASGFDPMTHSASAADPQATTDSTNHYEEAMSTSLEEPLYAQVARKDSGDGKRRVPPPPPPRKYKGPNGQKLCQGSGLPGDYENIENLETGAEEAVGGRKEATDPRSPAADQRGAYEQYHHSRSISEPISSTAIQPSDREALLRFEQNVMAGLQANMQRPDTQNRDQNNGATTAAATTTNRQSLVSPGTKASPPRDTKTLGRKEREPSRERRAGDEVWKRDAGGTLKHGQTTTSTKGGGGGGGGDFDKQDQQRLMTVHLHEQYWKLQRLQQQHKQAMAAAGPSGQKSGITTANASQGGTHPSETSPIITRSKVVINTHTGRKEEETDIF